VPRQRATGRHQTLRIIRMRIGTWNVEYARPTRLQTLRAALARNNADIWVLTETHDDLRPPGCGHAAHSSPRQGLGIRPGSRWTSIWSSYPLTILPVLDRERTVAALLDLGGSCTLVVYGTVMPWRTDPKFAPAERPLEMTRQCAESRDLQHAYPQADLCIAGDFNTDFGAGRYFTQRGDAALRDGLRACGLHCDRSEKGRLAIPPIDHVALPLRLRGATRLAACWPADKKNLSDHSGVVVEIDGFPA
jgi:hypothetical protein